MGALKGQLTLRGMIIGVVGCIILTAASAYTALKMGALPWPIIFAALVSLFFLKALGKTSLNEANVTHTIMSAGSMVAGGLAFTIPGIWILTGENPVTWWQMLIVALAGTILGLIVTAFIRRHFIEEAHLEFPIGESAAQTLIAGDSGGKTGAKLFGSLGIAGIYTALRDWLGVLPAMFLSNVSIPGVTFGIYNSPMMLAVGFLVGTGAVVAWFAGAVFANFGLIVGGSSLGWWDVTTAQGIVSSLGMGVMMGCGIAVIVVNILPKLPSIAKGMFGGIGFGAAAGAGNAVGSTTGTSTGATATTSATLLSGKATAGVVAFILAAIALVICFALQLGPVASIIVVLMVWVATAMSAQSVGQTGIDPMEIFGLIVLLMCAALTNLLAIQLFFIAGIIAVACGLAGDVMNDFHAGHVLHTSPAAQWLGQAFGGIIGAVVATVVMVLLVQAYGPDAFGTQGTFVAAQASVVATMISGIPSLPAFVIGLVVGFVLHWLKAPAMMIGLGIYLPFYMSFTAFLGAMAKVVYDALCRIRRRRVEMNPATPITAGAAVAEAANSAASSASDAAPVNPSGSVTNDSELKRKQDETGLVVASGLLGGESIVGVLVALAAVLAIS